MTKEEKNKLEKFVEREMKSKTMKEAGFSKTKVLKLFSDYIKTNPGFNYSDSAIFITSYDGKDEDRKEGMAIIKLIEENCKDCSIVSKDKHKAILIGTASEEIASKIKIDFATAVPDGKNRVRLDCKFPKNRKLKCFGGKKVSDVMKEID